MDYHRDNPFIRFAAFWWGLGAFLIFAVLLAAIALFNRDAAPSLEDVVAKQRYETKAQVEQAQAEALSKEAVHAAIPVVAKALAASKPAAVEKPDQVIPGSETAKRLAEAPPVDTTAVDNAAPSDAPIDPAVMELGKAQYMVCMGCHGMEGQGGPAGPPLAGSEWVTGPVSNLIRIQLRGLDGPITVAGKEYSFPPPGMPAQAYQTDEQVAAVLTFIRNSFGNKASAVKPEQVQALRSEVGKPALSAADLIQP